MATDSGNRSQAYGMTETNSVAVSHAGGQLICLSNTIFDLR
jgi:hypothetical protein